MYGIKISTKIYTINCGIGCDKTQTSCRYRKISFYQLLKYEVINCGTNNLDNDNPDEISNGLSCIALFLQKRMKHLCIVVNGLIPRDAINTERRQKLLIVNQLLQEKCTNYTSAYFLKSGKD